MVTKQVGIPLVLADDLSGAAESAAALGVLLRPELFLWPDVPETPSERTVVVDLDSRHLAGRGRRGAHTHRARGAAGPEPLFTKIDSLLRGNIGAEVVPLVTAGRLVVLTPALPQQGRSVVGGVLLDNGIPLDRTHRWTLEPAAPPPSVRAVLAGLPVSEIGLATVRGAGLAQALERAAGTVAVCDAENQDDLAAIVDAALRADPGVRFVGSSALARALAPHLTQPPSRAPAPERRPARGGVLYVLGTGSDTARAQAEVLQERIGAARYPVGPRDLADLNSESAHDLGRELSSHLGARSVLVQVKRDGDSGRTGPDIVAGLGRLVAATLAAAAPDWPVRLVLSGGETARAVLDALGCRRLAVIEEIHPGAVLMATDAGWLVATRPGSHGGPDSLWAIHQAMYADPTQPGENHE